MDKKKLLAMLAKKEVRKAELGTKGATTEDIAELRGINTELEGLNADIAELRSMIDAMPDDPAPGQDPEFRGDPKPGANPEQRAQPAGALNVLGTYGVGGNSAPEQTEERFKELAAKYEQRGADLKAKKSVTFDVSEIPEFRATTIGGGTLVVPTRYSNTLSPTFNQVSGLVDNVASIPFIGGESYTKGFEIGYGEGGYTTETGDYTDSDPETDYVSINKAKVTAYSEISDEAIKLPNIDYQALVAKNVGVSIRKKMTRQILAGTGGANSLVGIFNAPANVMPLAGDLTISEIDADTLDTIVIGYGGDEEIEGGCYLVLNKTDLAAFAAVRDADGKKLYTIKLNGNTGTISSEGSFEVPFIINSICPSLSSDATAADTYCMVYGKLMSYEMPIFSAFTVEESRDYKFKSGQIAYRGSVWAGGNVVSYKGFTRIKKG